MFLQLIGLIILVLKIVVLSTVYTTIIFLILFLIQKKTKNTWLTNRMKKKFRNWLFIHFIISCLFINYSFTYWEDTGLGDDPSLPIGYEQRIYSPNFEWTCFYPDLNKTELNKDELIIKNFIVKDNFLCAEVSKEYANNPKYDFIICDLQNKTNVTFNTEKEYNVFAKEKNLPLKSQFYDFKTHWFEFFNNKPTWKKWLLPYRLISH